MHRDSKPGSGRPVTLTRWPARSPAAGGPSRSHTIFSVTSWTQAPSRRIWPVVVSTVKSSVGSCGAVVFGTPDGSVITESPGLGAAFEPDGAGVGVPAGVDATDAEGGAAALSADLAAQPARETVVTARRRPSARFIALGPPPVVRGSASA